MLSILLVLDYPAVPVQPGQQADETQMLDLRMPVSCCTVLTPRRAFLAEGLRAWDEGWGSISQPTEAEGLVLGVQAHAQ